MALATITGMPWLNMPYISHKTVPNVNSEYINSDMPDVSLVLMVLMAWGKKEMEVQSAATKPMMST